MTSDRPERSARSADGDAHDDLTTVHVQRARSGDQGSTAWLVERFGPLLLAQARYRLGPSLVARVDPEDIVQEVWATSLPRLGELGMRGGRSTPVVLRFLATTLLHHVNNLLRRAATARPGESAGELPLASLPASTRGPRTSASAAEQASLLLAAIDALSERDRELVILRGIEQLDNDEVARELGLTPNAAAQAYRRALTRVREQLPGSVLDELEA